MFNQFDIQDAASAGDALGELFVGLAGVEVAGGVVVDDGQGDGIVLQGGAENDAEVDRGLGETAGTNPLSPSYFVSLV